MQASSSNVCYSCTSWSKDSMKFNNLNNIIIKINQFWFQISTRIKKNWCYIIQEEWFSSMLLMEQVKLLWSTKYWQKFIHTTGLILQCPHLELLQLCSLVIHHAFKLLVNFAHNSSFVCNFCKVFREVNVLKPTKLLVSRWVEKRLTDFQSSL